MSQKALFYGHNKPTTTIVCTPVFFVTSQDAMYDAIVGDAYSFNMTLGGTAPYILSGIIKPSWMTVALNGDGVTVNFTGTAPSTANNQQVYFIATNCSGGSTVIFNQTINSINSGSCVAGVITGSTILQAGVVGSPYSKSISITGTGPFSISITSIPAWMNVSISGMKIIISGTPNVAGSNMPVQFSLLNCSASSVAFNSTITVTNAVTPTGVTFSSEIIGGVINGLFDESWLVFGTDMFPASFGNNKQFGNNGYSGNINVNCNTPVNARVEIYINNAINPNFCHGNIGTGSQTYSLGFISLLSTDTVLIKLQVGPNCP